MKVVGNDKKKILISTCFVTAGRYIAGSLFELGLLDQNEKSRKKECRINNLFLRLGLGQKDLHMGEKITRLTMPLRCSGVKGS